MGYNQNQILRTNSSADINAKFHQNTLSTFVKETRGMTENLPTLLSILNFFASCKKAMAYYN
jgi:hypothetical protein